MNFHFPKPLHGWRAFVGEVGVIVLGVLIALGATKLMDDWQWREQIKLADSAFLFDLDTAATNAYVRIATEPCLRRRLSLLEAKLANADHTWKGMPEKLNFPDYDFPAPYHGYLPTPPISTNAWRNALANGVVSHLGTARAAYLSDAFDAASEFSEDRRKEGLAITRLAPLAWDMTLDPSDRIMFLQELRLVQRLDDEIRDDSEAIIWAVKLTGVGITDETIRKGSAGMIADARRVRGACVVEPETLP